MTMEQMPFLPPIDADAVESINQKVAERLFKLGEFTWDTFFPIVSGLFSLSDEKRYAFYLSREPLVQWITQPNQIATGELDESGMPIFAPAPSLLQLNTRQSVMILRDAAKLYKRFSKLE